MKKIITSALVIALTIGAAQAQETSTEKSKGYKKEHRMGGFDQLDLTADQKARLQTLRNNFKKQNEELKNNTQLTAEQKQARRRELHQQFRSQSEAILTPAQKEQLAKMKTERQANGKQKMGTYGKGFDRGVTFQRELNLTQEQEKKMQQIRSEYRSKFEAVHQDDALTQEQKRAKMQELMKAQQEQMKTVLTKEQAEKMESMRKEHRARNTK
ncbi:MAG: hypothetical protein ICV53_11405 [Flavisolibacter sp.]|nr:hypothetical protein [Flavisolibacter sp.]